MLKAQSTRDLNQAARTASRYLAESGFVLPHAKALDLVARLVGKPNHMAAQAALPDLGLNRPVEVKTWADLQAAISLLTPEQLAMSLTVSEGCDDSGDAEFFPAGTFLRAGDVSLLAASDGVLEAQQPVLLFPGQCEEQFDDGLTQPRGQLVPAVVVEDLCRILALLDREQVLHAEGVSDAAYNALAAAAPFVRDEILLEMGPDALREAYDTLPVSVGPEQLLQGEGHGQLTADELAQAHRLAEVLAPVQGLSEDTQRLMAQFELAVGRSGWFIPQMVRLHGSVETVRRINKCHSLALSLGDYLIASDQEQGFWCNNFGWTSSKLAASGFPGTTAPTRMMPADAVLRPYSETRDYDEGELPF